MRTLISVILTFALASAGAWAAEEKGAKVLNDTERARVKGQVESLQKSKLGAAGDANRAIKGDAIRGGQSVDQKLRQQQEQVDAYVEGYMWRSGGAAQQAGTAKKQQLEAQARAEKQKITAEARRRAAEQSAAAKKAADNVSESIEGLKSQVSKGGKYGLQPKGSNMYVRQYGKN